MALLIVVAALVLPVSGGLLLHGAIGKMLEARVRGPWCPRCGYDETGRASGSVCPECGTTRDEAVARTYRRRYLPMLWPLAAPAVVGVPFAIFAREISDWELAWAVLWLVAPAVVLSVIGLATNSDRIRRAAWICVYLPTIAMVCAATVVYGQLAQPMKATPGTPLYLPGLVRQAGPLLYAMGCGIVLGMWHIAAAIGFAWGSTARR